VSGQQITCDGDLVLEPCGFVWLKVA
jgi:hypothetical protein